MFTGLNSLRIAVFQVSRQFLSIRLFYSIRLICSISMASSINHVFWCWILAFWLHVLESILWPVRWWCWKNKRLFVYFWGLAYVHLFIKISVYWWNISMILDSRCNRCCICRNYLTRFHLLGFQEIVYWLYVVCMWFWCCVFREFFLFGPLYLLYMVGSYDLYGSLVLELPFPKCIVTRHAIN